MWYVCIFFLALSRTPTMFPIAAPCNPRFREAASPRIQAPSRGSQQGSVMYSTMTFFLNQSLSCAGISMYGGFL